MEENKKKYSPDSIWAPNKIAAILIYVFTIFILGALLIYLFAYIYSSLNNVSYDEIIKSVSSKTDELASFSNDILKANAVVQGLGNMFAYLIAAILICFFTRDEIKYDLFKFKDKKLYYAWFIPVAVILFVLIGYLVDLLVTNYTTASENQIQIENIIKNGGLAPMIISTLLLAPLVEELVFRKCIFSLCKKRLIIAYILSIVLFALPHMITTSASFGDWALKCLPYLVSGAMLAAIYHLSGYNVYVSLMAHMANNILAIILVLV